MGKKVLYFDDRPNPRFNKPGWRRDIQKAMLSKIKVGREYTIREEMQRPYGLISPKK